MKRATKSAIDSVKDALVKSHREDLIHKTDEELRQSQLSLFDLAPWDDDMRAMPNDYARSALFTVRNKKKKREACDNKAIFHVNKDVSITYTGIELRAEDDELVWQQILEYAKSHPLGEKIHFSFYQLCSDLGWAINGRYYKKAEECLTRLQATSMIVTSERLGRLKSLSLIKEFDVVERGTKKAVCEVELSPQMVYLFAGDHYTKFTWIIYRKLSPITRRLFDYMASHKEPFPLKLETFKMMCGSDTEQGWKWKQQAKDACTELAESGLVGSSWVQGDAIFCVRAAESKPGEADGKA
ncbi:TPA: replication initiator protein A [Escherichia coli]|nr:replication initiator protein A [Escherichia coli]